MSIGYDFQGWYKSEVFSNENKIEKIDAGSFGNLTLYARWDLELYSISYELNGGTNASGNKESYSIITPTITLYEPTKDGYMFGGWYLTEDFSGNEVKDIEKGSYGDYKLYAKWIENSEDNKSNEPSGCGSSVLNYGINLGMVLIVSWAILFKKKRDF